MKPIAILILQAFCFFHISSAQCETPELRPIANLDLLNSTEVDNISLQCLGVEVEFSASATAASEGRYITEYSWLFQDGSEQEHTTISSTTHVYTLPAIYGVELIVTDNMGCMDTTILQTGIIGPPVVSPEESVTTCLNSEINLLATYVPVPINNANSIESSLVSEISSESPYISTIQVNGFPASAFVENCNDIEAIHANIYHSWMSDLEIKITCPNGSSVILAEFAGNSSWVDLGYLGVGYDYSWSTNATNGTLLETADIVSSVIPAGDYSADGNICDLVGCPLNGEWTFEIHDYLQGDNGECFGWGIELSLYGSPSENLSFLPTIDNGFDDSHWGGSLITTISENGDEVVINTSELIDSNILFTTTDNAGCTFEQEIAVHVIENPISVITPETFAYDINFPDEQFLTGQLSDPTLPYEINWHWTPEDGLDYPYGQSTLVLFPNEITQYELTATSPQLPGCSASSSTIMIYQDAYINGYVFYDANTNGLYDTGEITMPNFPLNYESLNAYSFTDENGYYQYAIESIENTVSVNVDNALWTMTTSNEISVDLSNELPEFITQNFGVIPSSTPNTIVDGTFSYSPNLCLMENIHTVKITNEGNTHPSGYFTYQFDEAVEFLYAYPTPDLVDNNILQFSFPVLDFGQFETYEIVFQMPETSIDINLLNYELTTYVEDIIVDQDSINSELLCSYDPNEIIELNGYGHEGYLAPNTELDYVIHFQNTGDAPAYDVVITDQLPYEIDPTSFEPILASHPFIVSVSESGFITVLFENINLPDSLSSFDESMGFIHFRVSQIADLAHGTIINNQANIYFDENPPITTNMEENMILICEDTPIEITYSNQVLSVGNEYNEVFWYQDGQIINQSENSINAPDDGVYYAVVRDIYGCLYSSNEITIVEVGITEGERILQFKISPNPASDYLTIYFPAQPTDITIYSSDGKMVDTIQQVATSTFIDCSDLPQGSYYVKFNNGLETHFEKFLIVR